MGKTTETLLVKEDFKKRTDLPRLVVDMEYQTFHHTVTDKTFPCYFGMGC